MAPGKERTSEIYFLFLYKLCDYFYFNFPRKWLGFYIVFIVVSD